MKTNALMSGNKPNAWSETSKEEQKFCIKLFREYINRWLRIFNRKPTLYAFREMWKWARQDAYITLHLTKSKP